jgi:hypothetical protein
MRSIGHPSSRAFIVLVKAHPSEPHNPTPLLTVAGVLGDNSHGFRGSPMIEFLNPDADVGIENTPYDLSVKVDGVDATTIGLLANGFPDSVPFLDEVGKAIGRLRPGINLKAYNKGNATIAAPEKLLGEIGGDCVGVIAAYGH